jgi:hypothetical protein
MAEGESSYCPLAALRITDCVLAAGPDGSAVLAYDSFSKTWISSSPLAYPGGAGFARFWFDKGTLHFGIDVATGSGVSHLELLNCGDGCFTGGPLTGHESESGSGSGAPAACTGVTFSYCLSCTPCVGITSPCAPGVEIPATLYLAMTGDTLCSGSWPLQHGTVAFPGDWCSDPVSLSGGGGTASFGFRLFCLPGGVWGLSTKVTFDAATLVSFDATSLTWVFTLVMPDAYNPYCAPASGEVTMTITVVCVGGSWYCSVVNDNLTLASYDCSVPTWTFTQSGTSSAGCTSGYTVTITV